MRGHSILWDPRWTYWQRHYQHDCPTCLKLRLYEISGKTFGLYSCLWIPLSRILLLRSPHILLSYPHPRQPCWQCVVELKTRVQQNVATAKRRLQNPFRRKEPTSPLWKWVPNVDRVWITAFKLCTFVTNTAQHCDGDFLIVITVAVWLWGGRNKNWGNTNLSRTVTHSNWTKFW